MGDLKILSVENIFSSLILRLRVENSFGNTQEFYDSGAR
jgi:hypothetical protein